MTIWPKWKEDRVYTVAILVLVISAVLYLGVKTDNLLKQSEQIGLPTPYEHTITIDGEGKAIGKPDIATVTLGTESKGVDVATAQTANSTVMNKIIDQLKALAISEDDIQTSSYNVYEDTQWNDATQTYESVGWIVSNYVDVKVRDTSKLATVLAMAGQNGITNIYGPTFTIDDTTNLKAEARTKAIEQANKKMITVANSLGMRVEKVIGYTEWSPSDDYGYASMAPSYLDAGGVPTVAPGTNEVVLDVSVTYKLVD
ncbi:MAG: SIMPL domain-containing protein [Candidatus Uhrbacteria bacterium]